MRAEFPLDPSDIFQYSSELTRNMVPLFGVRLVTPDSVVGLPMKYSAFHVKGPALVAAIEAGLHRVDFPIGKINDPPLATTLLKRPFTKEDALPLVGDTVAVDVSRKVLDPVVINPLVSIN